MLCKNCGTVEAEEGSDYCEDCYSRWLAIKMTPNEQEALSRAHSDDVIRLLILSSGAVAVFNNARELCGIIPEPQAYELPNVWELARDVFFPPKKAPAINLEELGLV